MNLQELIATLEKHDPAKTVRMGFSDPHSYRGDYSELAFEPKEHTTVGAMLVAARSALGATFQGYKGGDYRMDEWTHCWLAQYGCSGETIGPILLGFMLGEYQ